MENPITIEVLKLKNIIFSKKHFVIVMTLSIIFIVDSRIEIIR